MGVTIESYTTRKGRRYRVRWRDLDRKSREKAGFKRQEAETFAAQIRLSLEDGSYVQPSAGKETISKRGASRLKTRRATLKPSSWRAEESTWRIHVEPTWGSRAIGKIRPSDVREWVAELVEKGASPTTVARAHGILSGILQEAVDDRLIHSNPAAGVPLPRKAPAPRAYLTHEQVERLARATRTPMHATIVRTLAYTGLRWGELAGLRVKHVNEVRRRFNIEENAVANGGNIAVGTPKTHERRSVPYPKFLNEEINALIAGKGPEGILFGDGLTHLRPSNSRDGWFVKAVRRCQQDDPHFPTVTPHGLRHTAASLAISSGAHVKAVQRMLGHASAAMTLDTYADLFDDDLDAVSDALSEARSQSIVGVLWGQAAQK